MPRSHCPIFEKSGALKIRQVGNEIIIKIQFRFLGHTCMISCKICTDFLLPGVLVDSKKNNMFMMSLQITNKCTDYTFLHKLLFQYDSQTPEKNIRIQLVSLISCGYYQICLIKF